MHVSEVPFQTCDVMMFGRELDEVVQSRVIHYVPSYRTLQVADTVGSFYQSYPGDIARIISSGGYPELARNMLRPVDGSSEGEYMAQRLDEWGVRAPVYIEGNSTHTFSNFHESIYYGLLPLTGYKREHPLIISCNEAHATRVVMLARSILNLTIAEDRESLYLLRPFPETDMAVHARERMLAKLTKYAIETIALPYVPSGSFDISMHLFDRFAEVWDSGATEEESARNRAELLHFIDATYGPEWDTEELRHTEVIDHASIS